MTPKDFNAIKKGDVLIPDKDFVMDDGVVAYHAKQPVLVIRSYRRDSDDIVVLGTGFISQLVNHGMRFENVQNWVRYPAGDVASL